MKGVELTAGSSPARRIKSGTIEPTTVLWAVLLGSLGFFGTGTAEALLGGVVRIERWLLGAAAATVLVLWLTRRLRAA